MDDASRGCPSPRPSPRTRGEGEFPSWSAYLRYSARGRLTAGRIALDDGRRIAGLPLTPTLSPHAGRGRIPVVECISAVFGAGEAHCWSDRPRRWTSHRGAAPHPDPLPARGERENSRRGAHICGIRRGGKGSMQPRSDLRAGMIPCSARRPPELDVYRRGLFEEVAVDVAVRAGGEAFVGEG